MLELIGRKWTWPPLPSPRTSLGTHVLLRVGSRKQNRRKDSLQQRKVVKEIRKPEAAILSPGSLDTEGSGLEPESPRLLTLVV